MATQRLEIRVGMTASLSGRYSYPGKQSLAGAQAWAEDTNLSGGIRLSRESPGLPVRFVHYDDESRASRCQELVERLIADDRVDLLIGPYSSGLAQKASLVAQQYRRVLWNQGGALRASGGGSAWVVDILTPARSYFHGLIDKVRAGDPSARNVAIVHSTAGAFPEEVASGAREYCRLRGFELVRDFPYEARTTDFGPILEDIRASSPDLVLEVGRIEDDILFARQYVERGISSGAAGLIAVPLALFRDSLGEAAEGFSGPSQWEPGVIASPDYGPTSAEVLKSLSRIWASGVDYPMAQAYAGCLIAQRCVEASGSVDNSTLRMTAGQLDFTTFYGRFKIDPQSGRQTGHTMPVVQWKGGEKVIVWPPEMAHM